MASSPRASSQSNSEYFDYSWKAMLHRDLLESSQSCLAETPLPLIADDKAAIELGFTCLTKKTICQKVPLPSDPKITEVFERIAFRAIREATKTMIDQRTFTLNNEALSYETRKKMSEKAVITPGDVILVAQLKEWIAKDDERFSSLRNEIQLLTEWSEAPLRVFTDALGHI